MNRRRRPRMPRPARAGALLEELLQGLGLDERLQQARALVIWDEVVGPQIAARTRPNRVRDGVLEVCVDQPAWMQQLQLMKPQLLAKLNRELGDIKIKDIFLKRGKVSERAAAPNRAPLPWRTVALDPQEKQQVAALLTTIDDPELRRELENFLVKQTKLMKSRAVGGTVKGEK